MKRQHSAIANVALLLGALALVLLSLELGLALISPRKVTARPFFHIQSFFCRYDPLLGWANKEGYRDVVRVDDERSFVVTHNSRGMRDRERSTQKPPGVGRRMLAFGDSFVWGFGVADDEVFTREMERLDPAIEALNFGVSGYGTDQEYLFYKQAGGEFEHDLVVLAFYANDIDEMSSTISYGYPKPLLDPDTFENLNYPVPRTTETDRKLYGEPSTAWGRATRFLRRHTHTYPFLASRLNSVPALRAFFLKIGLAEEYERGFRRSDVPFIRIDDRAKALRLHERILGESQALARSRGADFLLVSIPIKENTPGAALKYPDATGAEARENDSISRGLGGMAAKVGVPYLDLLPFVREGHKMGIAYYSASPMDIHLSAEGHRMMATAILDRLKRP